MTHGHELKERNAGRRGCAGQRGIKEGEWDNCNTIINKIYLKNKDLENFENKCRLETCILLLTNVIPINSL